MTTYGTPARGGTQATTHCPVTIWNDKVTRFHKKQQDRRRSIRLPQSSCFLWKRNSTNSSEPRDALRERTRKDQTYGIRMTIHGGRAWGPDPRGTAAPCAGVGDGSLS